MGYGNYSHAAHEALTHARASLPTQALFKQRSCHPLMDPKGVILRESRDSAEHPNSLGIVFALDVTGSMGEIPELLARKELPNFMKVLSDCKVSDPQVLFTAVGDATCDRAPLQVGQFETTAELMDQWLTWSYLERGGGGGNRESYELALYLLAEHTQMDCWVKREKRGYLFMTGDELPYPAVSRHQVEALIGEKLDEDIPTEALMAELQETFEPFFLVPDPHRATKIAKQWRALLGDHVIVMQRPEDTCYVAAGLVALHEGVVGSLKDLATLLDRSGADPARIGRVVAALEEHAASFDASGRPKVRHAGLAKSGKPSLFRRLVSGK